MQGLHNPSWGTFQFYTQFSSPTPAPLQTLTKGSKPFILAETGATFHYAYNELGLSNNRTGTPDLTTVPRMTLKRAWWRQFLNQEFLSLYPNFKAACTFEFVKSEEETLRDFTNFGAPPMNRTGNEDGDEVVKAFVEDARGMGFVRWAKAVTALPTSVTVAPTGLATSAVGTGTASGVASTVGKTSGA
ncbi:hypothetical protein HDU67_006130, partial [Dinochytrium kinnereticum]